MTLELSPKSRDVEAMFDRIAGRYDLLNRLLSARQDVRWRKALIASLPSPGLAPRGGPLDGVPSAGVLYDVACGTGDVMIETLARRPDYGTVAGFDISRGMMDAGRGRKDLASVVASRKARGLGAEATFTHASAESLPAPGASADAVSIAFGLRNVDDRAKALREFHRVLRPGGRVLVLEFFAARSTLFAKAFDLYFKKVLPAVGGLISDRASYEYLPRSVSTMPSGEAFAGMLREAGFNNVTERSWLSGATRLFVAEK